MHFGRQGRTFLAILQKHRSQGTHLSRQVRVFQHFSPAAAPPRISMSKRFGSTGRTFHAHRGVWKARTGVENIAPVSKCELPVVGGRVNGEHEKYSKHSTCRWKRNILLEALNPQRSPKHSPQRRKERFSCAAKRTHGTAQKTHFHRQGQRLSVIQR